MTTEPETTEEALEAATEGVDADDADEALEGAGAEIQSKLAIALDVDDLVLATRWGRQMRPYFGIAKVGLELYSAAGPDAVSALRELGYDVFLDLKLHDIPNTVGRTARVLGALGVDYLTVHCFGGTDMMKAGVEGLAEGASAAGLEPPVVLGVTVLTSDGGAPDHIVPQRVRVAAEAGAGGLIVSASDVADARSLAPRMLMVTPGIRPEGSPANDQASVATPKEAIDAGSDILVIGRAVTAADDPVEAAEGIVSEMLS